MQKLALSEIRLTETVQKGGCAAKLPAGQLRTILSQLPMRKLGPLTVGTENMDDACVWNLGNGQSLIQTLDFFTPIVDDAYDFGAIAAANALSDVYAMGGAPKIALSILAFPAQTLPVELIGPLLNGALDKIHEAGACLAGGHTIDDDTLKFGLSVSGFVDSAQVWTNQGAKVGDVLVLTKALGTGTITTALKLREASQVSVDEAVLSMKQLNRVPEILIAAHLQAAVNAATDITGFGLAGHALQMARASQVSFEIELERVPSLSGARELIANEYLNRAHRTNHDYVKDDVKHARASAKANDPEWLLVDPQTSGGLLLSVPEAQVESVVNLIKPNFLRTCVIGRVVAQSHSVSQINLI